MAEIEVYPDTKRLARAAADHFVALADKATTSRGQFSVALAGGSTPKALYTLLATDQFAERVDWSRIHLFWGDERSVPPTHPDSNFRMTRVTLLDHVPIPAHNVHRIPGEIEPQAAAAQYEHLLKEFFTVSHGSEDSLPRFDLILLGMGDDGHTASLFPGTVALHERARWVVAHHVEKLGMWRITLTPIVINAANNVTFVVAGEGKAKRLQQVIEGPYQPETLPSQLVDPTHGRLLWFVDSAAASHLRQQIV